MKQIELLMRLQRLLDEETTASGPDEGADLLEQMEEAENLDDLGAGGGELQEVFGMIREKDDLDGELEELLGGGDIEGVEAELGLAGLKLGGPGPDPGGAASRRESRGERGAGAGGDRPLRRLLRDTADRRRARGAGGAADAGAGKRAEGGGRPVGRLLDILQAIGDLRDRQSEATELRRLRRFMFQREAPGGLGTPEPRDPVVARRRKQLNEFFAAWREALATAPPAAETAPAKKDDIPRRSADGPRAGSVKKA